MSGSQQQTLSQPPPNYDRYIIRPRDTGQEANSETWEAFTCMALAVLAGFQGRIVGDVMQPSTITLDRMLRQLRFDARSAGNWAVTFVGPNSDTDSEAERLYVQAEKKLAAAIDRMRRQAGDVAIRRSSLLNLFQSADIDLDGLEKFIEIELDRIAVAERGKQVYEAIKQTDALPMVPENVLKILRLARDDRAGVDKLVPLIERDPALAGRLLQYVNSSFFGLISDIPSIKRAVSLLGTRQITMVAFGLAIRSQKIPCCPQFDYDRFWQQSGAQAVAARRMAKSTGGCDPEEAFAAGLLCQIGRLALASVFPEQYGAIIEQTVSVTSDWLREKEREVFGIDHAELAARMFADWGIADSFCQAVQHQGTPDNLVGKPHASTLANILSWSNSVSSVFTWPDANPNRQVLVKTQYLAARVGLPDTEFTSAFNTLITDWEDIGKVLEFNTPEVKPWPAILQPSS